MLSKIRLSKGITLDDVMIITNFDKKLCEFVEEDPANIPLTTLSLYFDAIGLTQAERLDIHKKLFSDIAPLEKNTRAGADILEFRKSFKVEMPIQETDSIRGNDLNGPA